MPTPTYDEVVAGDHQNEVSWTYRIAVCSVVVLVIYFALITWGKYDFCQGWANHYAAQAAKLRSDARDPQYSDEEKRELLIAAEWHEIISKKYAVVASQPWRDYPRAPLITPQDQRLAISRVDQLSR